MTRFSFIPLFILLLTPACQTGGEPMSLHRAAIDGRADIVKSLLYRGANVEEPDEGGGGWRALHWAAAYGYADVVQLLPGARGGHGRQDE